MKRKKMSHWLYLAAFFGLNLSSTAAYRTYYVEDKCTPNNHMQNVEYHVSPEGSASVGELRTNRFGTYSRQGRSCMISIIPPKGYGVVASVTKVDFRNHHHCKDYIKVFHQDTQDGEKLCDYEERGLDRKSYFSEGTMKLLYHTENGGWGYNDGFRLIFTVAKTALGNEKTASCSSLQQFECSNKRCIWIGLTCDGNDNCGDASDEKYGGNSDCPPISPVVIATVVLMITIFAAILIAMLICCCKYKKSSVSDVTVLIKPHSRRYGYVPLRGCNTYGSFGSLPSYHTVQYPSAPPSPQRDTVGNYNKQSGLKHSVRIVPPHKTILPH